MDFAKFISLLESQSLYFPNIYSFEDALEGAHNALNDDDHYDIDNDGNIIVTEPPTEQRHIENSLKLKTYLKNTLDEMAGAFGIQCWRMSDNESHAMWKIFLSANEGVAIKTDLETVKDCLPAGHFHLGKVQYIDRKTKKMSINQLLNSFFTKESHFKHESEFRIITYNVDQNEEAHFGNNNLVKNEHGIIVLIPTESLIKEVLVSPYAPKWFYELVLSIKERYKFSAPVLWSEIKLR